jgi:hypothetical protein
MMDAAERKRRIADLEARARVDAFIPWWAMDLIRILGDVVSDVDDLGEGQEDLEEHQVSQQKALKSLRDQYSELMYKLKSGD